MAARRPCPGLWERALPLSQRTRPRSTHVILVDARRAVDGRMKTARGPTTTTPHPTSMPCVAQHCRWLRPHRAPRLVQSWHVVEVEWALDGKNLGEDGGDAVGRAPSWCTACLPGRWRAVSLPANALAAMDGSPPPTPMGGGRFSHGWRRNLRSSRFNIFKNSSYRSGGSLQCFETDASTVSPTHTVLRLVGCHGVACTTMASATSPGSASD